MSNYTFENLTQSGLIRAYSKDNKNVSFSVDTFGGFTSFVVFTGAGGKPWKVNLPRKTINNILILLRKMKNDIRPCREPIILNMFDPDIKKFKQVGQIGIGIDENLVFQIDIAHNDLNGRHIFPIKHDAKFDFSNTSLSEKELLESQINWLIDALSLESVVAERLSSFKRQNTGNRGGYNNQNRGGGNYQNTNSDNGGNRPPNNQQSSTFGGGTEFESELHV